MTDLHEWLTGRVAEAETAADTPAAARRCEADRRILDRHRLDLDDPYEPSCLGCGTYGDLESPNTDNINDCPELLDLAHAHGITDAILAGLDRPEPPPLSPVKPYNEALADALDRLRSTTPARQAPATFRPAPTRGVGIPITGALTKQRFNPWR
ncbi:hypothetical protein [Streptomyces showdoensis]|uniref:Uncharacterized protein n=1 Tax=Streptomyces showdoensis TaxID=68268 RepID=A0A2P2GV92_STREW|nr:hypothetical protein [Streptomyces showdoensis]KKZ74865.1 hypothetical protein VO63_05295 [Streptomyces showdoensis]